VDTFAIYKWTATAGTWASYTSVPAASTYSAAGFTYYDALAGMTVDANNKLHFTFVGQALRDNGSGSLFAMNKGIYYLSYSSGSWSSLKTLDSQVLPGVWTQQLDQWLTPFVLVDGSGKANCAYTKKLRNGGNQSVLIRPEDTAGSATFGTTQTVVNSAVTANLKFFFKDGTGVLHAVYVLSASYDDTYIAHGSNWAASTKIIDNTATSGSYSADGAVGDRAGKIHVLYSDASFLTYGFGLISNASGAWTVPGASTLILDRGAVDTPWDGTYLSQASPTGGLSIDSYDNLFFTVQSAIDTSHPVSGFYLYGRPGGTSTWVKGFTNIASWNALAPGDNLQLQAVPTPALGMMLVYSDSGLNTAAFLRGYETDFVAMTPNLVTLSAFTAQPQAGQVKVAWTTGTELDTAGFNVWGSSAPAGTYAKLNSLLIPAIGASPSGASYAWMDRGPVLGETRYYKLEDLDNRGASTFHGPVSATLGQAAPLVVQATPPDIFLGGRSTLIWTAVGAPPLTLNGVPVAGNSLAVSPLATTSYTLADTAGNASLVTVNVKAFRLEDMAALSKVWGSVRGDAAYDPTCDLNGDGKVDDADIEVCFSAF
jgi:hypothetical protein